MTMFNFATKAASALAVASVLIDSHDMGRRTSKRGFAQASADKFVRDNIGASKLGTDSSKHATIKKFVENADISDRFVEAGGGIGGYISGFIKGIKNNIFTLGFGTLAFIAKSKPGKVIGLTGMGISMVADMIVNSSNLFERRDYLDK